MNKKTIAIIGGGPAGLGAASALSRENVEVLVFDKQDKPGGHLNKWAYLFPGFVNASEVRDELMKTIEPSVVDWKMGAEVVDARCGDEGGFELKTLQGVDYKVDAVIQASGFNLFDAVRKEELGYGVYYPVVTSADVEQMLKGEKPFPVKRSSAVLKIGIVHCVGSRDEKSGNRYCSRMCCLSGVKQAIEIKKMFPNSRVTNFYMDMRMFGNGYEELYLTAQQKYGVSFIRGRVSEVSQNHDGRLMVKAEDTLLGRPVRGEFDMLVLMVGMEPNKLHAVDGFHNKFMMAENGFYQSPQSLINNQKSGIEGWFFAGTCKGPASVADCLADGKAAAIAAREFVTAKKQ
jgi:heterodisulfide reductase subunit A